ncbi:hypothetical protein [Lentzea jiangxiensis]|uniref:Uncharacterized protein n=1 Tax=Lentzea jiangxiensis TaxID=641025 RepID=A0A1H0L8F3_9PSEU|nr:hypothetical protein [Lentzea jiangxiensis]SDO64498.1 hypothetical protein SAMN05421507_103224 [Lentzea jiangxiensis]
MKTYDWRHVTAIPALLVVVAIGTMSFPDTAAAESRTTKTAWANDTFSVCSVTCSEGYAVGGIIWGNRTATVQGSVTNHYADFTTVYFDAFAGSTKVDSATRSSSAGDVSYRFDIGNPDLPGGVDRIRVQVCSTAGGDRLCGSQYNEIRD